MARYRPAASPIVTSKLPDGRTRIRGADVERLRAKAAAAAARERQNPVVRKKEGKEKARAKGKVGIVVLHEDLIGEEFWERRGEVVFEGGS